MPLERRRLTDAHIRSLPHPESGQVVYGDTESKALRVVVGTQSKRFAVQAYAGGKELYKTFAPTTLPVVEARKRANKLELEFKDRGGLAEVPGLTLRAAWDIAKRHWNNKGRSPRTISDYTNARRLYLGCFEERLLASITRRELVDWHAELSEKNGKVAADHAVKTLSAIYGRAYAIDPSLPPNPASAVSLNGTAQVNIDVSPARYAAVDDAIRQVNNEIRRAFLLFCLYSGFRPFQEIAVIKKEDVYLAEKALFIAQPKGGARKAFWSPMSSQMCNIVEQIINIESEWLFPAVSKSGHIATGRVPSLVKLQVETYDLRRMFASAAIPAGIDEGTLGILLNHSAKRTVTRGYQSTYVDYLRPPRQAINDTIDRLIIEGRRDR